jgi:hypothetical protein
MAPSCVNTPFPVFLEVCKAVLESTSWNAAELFCHDPLHGLNVIISTAFNAHFSRGNMKILSQGDKPGACSNTVI